MEFYNWMDLSVSVYPLDVSRGYYYFNYGKIIQKIIDLKIISDDTIVQHPDGGFIECVAAFYLGSFRTVQTLHHTLDIAYDPNRKHCVVYYHCITGYISVSDVVGSYLTDTVKIDRKKVKVIENGISYEFNTIKNNESQSIRIEVEIPDSHRIISLVGRLEREKNVSLLIKALKTFPDCTGVIVGDGSIRSELEQLAKDERVKNIQFVGYTAEPSKWFQIFDCFCIPSTSETFGYVSLRSDPCK